MTQPAPVGDQSISSREVPEGRRIDGHRRRPPTVHRRTKAQHLDIHATEHLDMGDRPVRATYFYFASHKLSLRFWEWRAVWKEIKDRKKRQDGKYGDEG